MTLSVLLVGLLTVTGDAAAQACFTDPHAAAALIEVTFPKCDPKALATVALSAAIESDCGTPAKRCSYQYSLAPESLGSARFVGSGHSFYIQRARLTVTAAGATFAGNVLPSSAHYKGAACVAVFEVECELLWKLTVSAKAQLPFAFQKQKSTAALASCPPPTTPPWVDGFTDYTIPNIGASDQVLLCVNHLLKPIPIDLPTLKDLDYHPSLRNLYLKKARLIETTASDDARIEYAKKLPDLQLATAPLEGK